ncbi:MAG TPA: hypothetical protein VKG85_01560 [Actinomycetes bacterium]|nr:hypothetical protein [Actinomycetes bacterium]
MPSPLATHNQPHARRWPIMVATILAAWLVAFLVVMALLTLFGDQLASLPLAVRALVLSGSLVALMVNLVMPVLSVVVARTLSGLAAGGDRDDQS